MEIKSYKGIRMTKECYDRQIEQDNQFTHQELNDYLEDAAYHAECIAYPEVAEQIRDAKDKWSIEEKIDFLINEQEYELYDEDGNKCVA